MSARYAIYFAPKPGSPLDELGSGWLGRNAWTGDAVAQPQAAGIGEITAEPGRYGFHATLKAPFALRTNEAEFYAAVANLAQRLPPVVIEKIALAEIGGFLALVPECDSDELRSLAASCVRDLDRHRAPLTVEEIERRRGSGLTSRQERLLHNWGYPFVLDEFRFHMTATRRLEAPEKAAISDAVRRQFAGVIGNSLTIDALTVFRQPAPRLPFVALQRFPLTGKANTVWPQAWKFGIR